MAEAVNPSKYKMFEEKIKNEILGRELLNKKVEEFTISLENLSDGDMRNIMRSRYRGIFREIKPIMHKKP